MKRINVHVEDAGFAFQPRPAVEARADRVRPMHIRSQFRLPAHHHRRSTALAEIRISARAIDLSWTRTNRSAPPPPMMPQPKQESQTAPLPVTARLQ